MGMRPQRVGELVLRELGELFQRGRVKDPDIGFVTFTAVDMSPDLRQARVFYSVYGTGAVRETTQLALDRAKGFVQREIGQRLRLKATPQLEFRFDASLDRADRIEQILHDISRPETDEHDEDEG